MLVLSRKRNESVVVGGPAEVYVVEIRSGEVRLGFLASAEVPINRREVHDAIQKAGGKDRPKAA